MLIRRLRWNLPSTQDVLTSGNFRSASAQARTRKSVIVTFSAPGTESFSCCRIATARSTRASTVTVNSGTVDFASAMRRAMVACIRVGSTTSTSGPGLPAMRGGPAASGRGGGVRISNAGDWGSNLGRNALLNDDVEHAVGLGLEVEGRLVGFDLGDHVAFLDDVTALLLPLDDGALLHRVGELGHVYISHRFASCRPPRARAS